MAEQLEKFKEEANQFNKDKLAKTMDENMDFHEWMEKHKKVASTHDGIENELDLDDLIEVGRKSGISHPFSLQSSPFFNNQSRELILEVKNPKTSDRPFPQMSGMALVDIRDNDGVALN